MKKIIYAVALLLAGCTSEVPDYVRECPNGYIYKEHKFVQQGVLPDENFLFTDKCKLCGLERKWDDVTICKNHEGSVYIYKRKETNKFDMYVLCYEENNKLQYQIVSFDELTNKNW